jgi:hypothetical protein
MDSANDASVIYLPRNESRATRPVWAGRRLGGGSVGGGDAPKFNLPKLMENHEKWMELCALASKEQDPAKLLALTQEIARLLEEKEQRVKGQLPATGESSG